MRAWIEKGGKEEERVEEGEEEDVQARSSVCGACLDREEREGKGESIGREEESINTGSFISVQCVEREGRKGRGGSSKGKEGEEVIGSSNFLSLLISPAGSASFLPRSLPFPRAAPLASVSEFSLISSFSCFPGLVSRFLLLIPALPY